MQAAVLPCTALRVKVSDLVETRFGKLVLNFSEIFRKFSKNLYVSLPSPDCPFVKLIYKLAGGKGLIRTNKTYYL